MAPPIAAATKGLPVVLPGGGGWRWTRGWRHASYDQLWPASTRGEATAAGGSEQWYAGACEEETEDGRSLPDVVVPRVDGWG